jgi:hypothetical protein
MFIAHGLALTWLLHRSTTIVPIPVSPQPHTSRKPRGLGSALDQ